MTKQRFETAANQFSVAEENRPLKKATGEASGAYRREIDLTGSALVPVVEIVTWRRLKASVTPSLWTAAIGHALVTLPFVVVIVNARLMGLDASFEEAARDLGATSFQSFRLVVFPLVAPALVGAVLIVVAWSFDELVITFFTSGGDPTLPVRIWGMLRRGIDPSVNAMAGVILVTTIACTLLAGRFISGREIAR